MARGRGLQGFHAYRSPTAVAERPARADNLDLPFDRREGGSHFIAYRVQPWAVAICRDPFTGTAGDGRPDRASGEVAE